MIQSYGLEDLYKPDFPGLKKVPPPHHPPTITTAAASRGAPVWGGGGGAAKGNDVGRKKLTRDLDVNGQMFFLQDQLMRCFLPNLHDHFHKQSIRTSSYITKVDPHSCGERKQFPPC
jgi:hypothetical protein